MTLSLLHPSLLQEELHLPALLEGMPGKQIFPKSREAQVADPIPSNLLLYSSPLCPLEETVASLKERYPVTDDDFCFKKFSGWN